MTVALSGGADSTALAGLAVWSGLEVRAVHVDHGIRPDRHRDIDAAQASCRRLGVDLKVVEAEVADGPNLEARARDARHAALPAGALLGHTMDDRAETVLLNVLRGAALDGLSAMRPERRPLLGLRRAETRALCVEAGLPFVDDPSNDDRRHLRNRIRHDLLPVLSEAAGRDLVPVLARQAGHLADDGALLDVLSSELDPTDARALADAPIALARRAVRRWLTTTHPPDSATVERVLAVARGEATATDVGGGRRVARRHQRLGLVEPGG